MNLLCSTPARRLLLLLLLGVWGCAGTRVTSLRDPSAPQRQYKSILVTFPIDDLETRTVAELELARELRDAKLSALVGHQEFFPGRTFSEAEFDSVVRVHAVDAVLLLRATASGADRMSLPAATYAVARGATISAVSIPGGSYSEPWANFSALLIDVELDRTVWVATVKSSSVGPASVDGLLKSMAREVVLNLGRDGLIGGPTDPWRGVDRNKWTGGGAVPTKESN